MVSLAHDSDPLARGLSLSHASTAEQTQALQRLLDGDIDSLPETAGVRELDTIGRLMDAFRSNVHALNRHANSGGAGQSAYS